MHQGAVEICGFHRRARIRAQAGVIMRKARLIAIWSILAVLIGGCVSQCIVLVESARAWKREVAPFEAVGARVVAGGGDDMGRLAGRAGVVRIYFDENVGDAELAALAKRMERFPNLDTLILCGPKVTDSGLVLLRGLKQLTRLKLFDTRVTEKGKSELLRELPNLQCDM